jgi:hypothetical protein
MADFTLKAHDRRPSIQATLSQGGAAVDLTTAVSVKFIMVNKAGGTVKVNTTAVIVTASQGVVRYDWGATDTDTPGSYSAEWEVTWSAGIKQTFPTAAYHSIAIIADLDNS